MSRRTLFGVVIGVAAAVTAAVVGSTASAAVSGQSRALCGTERWTVKTLQGRPRLLRVRAATLHFLVTRPAPHPLPDARQPFERHVYRVTAAVTLVRQEADGDLHLVLRNGSRHMIAEAPESGAW